jgi:hypothetical protein
MAEKKRSQDQACNRLPGKPALIMLFALSDAYFPKYTVMASLVNLQISNPNTNCKKIITVKAGGKGNGTTSNINAPAKTSKYCHHILLIYIFSLIHYQNSSPAYFAFPQLSNALFASSSLNNVVCASIVMLFNNSKKSMP